MAVDVAAGVEEEGAGSVPVPFSPEVPNVVVSLFSINASSDADNFVLSSQVVSLKGMRRPVIAAPRTKNPNVSKAAQTSQ